MNYRSVAGQQAVTALYEEALARWPAPSTTLEVPTRHGSTFIVACGRADAPPLVLLHGAAGNSAMWLGDVETYARSFRVYAVDLPGEAGKSAANRPSWKDRSFEEWLEDVLDGLGVQKASVVGISQGGWTALKFAVAQPERIERLVLLCPGGIVRDRYSFLFKAVALSLMGGWGRRRLVRLLFGHQTVPEGAGRTTGTTQRHFKSRVGWLPLFSDAELHRLTMPVLVLGGGRDPLRNLKAIVARLRALLPSLEVVMIPEAGHVLLDTGERIATFLEGPDPRHAG